MITILERTLIVIACLLSMYIVYFISLIELSHAELWYYTPSSHLETTKRPFNRTPGLSLPQPNINPVKCKKEVPAVFFQYDKEILVVGNSSINRHFNVIDVCCQGYKRYDYDWSKCVPDCGRKCQQNGFCLAGSVCQCFDEFVLNYRNNCVPTCPLGCPHGQCYLNGTCICDMGYELDASRRYCQPVCDLGCARNEVCDEPNTCICMEGYTRAEPDPLNMGCQPVCIPNCGYGHCIGPNRCQCFHGYQRRENSSVCESDCYMRCENGFCVNRTTCICQDGYKYDHNTTSCLPDCNDDCENGICTAPGVCRCFNGYRRSGNRCDAICEKGCGFYGKCIAPNVCGCAITDGPFASFQQCDFGHCNARGQCRCSLGTTRFIDRCLPPDKVTAYASSRPHHFLNNTISNEFHLLIGQYYILPEFDPLTLRFIHKFN